MDECKDGPFLVEGQLLKFKNERVVFAFFGDRYQEVAQELADFLNGKWSKRNGNLWDQLEAMQEGRNDSFSDMLVQAQYELIAVWAEGPRTEPCPAAGRDVCYCCPLDPGPCEHRQ